jgi:hypothetical protein
MGTTPLDLPILISQLPFVQKIAHAEKATPEIQKMLFGPLITEHLRKNEGKVQEVSKKEETAPVDRDGQQNQQHQAASDKKRKEKDEEDSPETGASNASPWSGNIVNVKI